MLDFGITAQEKMEDYDTTFLNELDVGEEISGEIVMGEFKALPMGGREVAEFYLIITDHGNRKKWVCEFITPYYPETDNIYGENGGLFYTFIDSLNHVVNQTPINWQENYSVNFHQLRKTVNNNLSRVTIKTVKSPIADAKTVNLEVVDVIIFKKSKTPDSASIYYLAEENPVILTAYAHLRNKGDRITIENVRFELKTLFDDKNITEEAYQLALKELRRIKDI